jgi:hypothetical protein
MSSKTVMLLERIQREHDAKLARQAKQALNKAAYADKIVAVVAARKADGTYLPQAQQSRVVKATRGTSAAIGSSKTPEQVHHMTSTILAGLEHSMDARTH